MPMHDWTRVSAGIFYASHNSWITHLQETLNNDLLAPPYYALGEQRSGDVGPDVLTLQAGGDFIFNDETSSISGERMVALAEAPPQVSISLEAAEDAAFYLSRQRSVVIRHVSGDRIVALIEIVSPANKHTRQTVDDFVDKVVAALRDGIHVMVIDPFPPRRHDVGGMHAAIWNQLMAGDYSPVADKPLTLVSYCSRRPLKAYIEPTSVGDRLIDMPFFLTPDHYILVPLEATYMQSWSGVPQRWRRVIENSPTEET